METQPTALSNLQYSLLLDESPGHYRLRKFATKCSYWKKVKVISGMLLITLEAFILKKMEFQNIFYLVNVFQALMVSFIL